MTFITWDDALLRGIHFQDDDHKEAVTLMNAMQTCSDQDFSEIFAKHLEHVKAHFTREEEMMARTGFFALKAHSEEHQRILHELQAMQTRLAANEFAVVRKYVQEDLPNWFLTHLDTMDMVIAHVARQAGES